MELLNTVLNDFYYKTNVKISRRTKTTLTGIALLLIQTFIFRDYISPFQWGQLKVRGLACTCPDEAVISGKAYLRSITPDSLKKYNLDYSEIYVTEMPHTLVDPQGVDDYILTGTVIGKERVSEGDPWNPKIEVGKWRAINVFKDLAIKGLLFVQLIIFAFILRKSKRE